MSGIYGNDLRKIMRINSQIPIFPGQKAEIGHFDRPLRRQVKNLFSDIRRKVFDFLQQFFRQRMSENIMPEIRLHPGLRRNAG